MPGLSHSQSTPVFANFASYANGSSGDPPSDALRQQSKADFDARSRDIRLGFHMSKTPIGTTFQHVGTFTPMIDYKPSMAVQGYLGPWRSVGAYFEQCASALEREHVVRDDQRISRYWPYGKDVVKVHGSLDDEHFFMATRGKTKQDELGDLNSSGTGRWVIKNAFCEKWQNPPPARYPQKRYMK